MSKLSVIFFIFNILLATNNACGADLILDWINDKIPNTNYAPTILPSVSPFDEIQVRIDNNDRKHVSEGSIRVAFNPIDGFSNDLNLSRQRKVISDLEKNELEKSQKLNLYLQLLTYWKVNKSIDILNGSDFLFDKGTTYLDKIEMSQKISFDLTGFISNIANFNQIKINLTEQNEQLKEIIGTHRDNSNDLFNSINNIEFIKPDLLLNIITNQEANSNILIKEENLIKLKTFELTKKEKEHYQIFKFISFQRKDQGIQQPENTYQLAFRIPILSDNHEYEKAKLDYLMSKNKIDQQIIEKKSDFDKSLSYLKGLVKKDKIYAKLPKKSKNTKMYFNSIENLDGSIKNEITFIKIQLDAIQVKYEIYEKYLTLLSISNQFSSNSINYLIQDPITK